MSTQQLLIDTVGRICQDHATKEALDKAEAGEYPSGLWRLLLDNGLHDLATPASGLEAGDIYAVFRTAAAHAMPLPLAEAVLGRAWLQQLDIDSGQRLVSIGFLQDDALVGVPWGRERPLLLGLRLGEAGWQLHHCEARSDALLDANLAGEPRDDIPQVTIGAAIDEPLAFEKLALARTVQMAGTLSSVLDLSLAYVNEREQFGRPLAKFQAIQHALAVLAAEVAAAMRASDSAVAALSDERFSADLAAAKARVGEAVGVVAESAHQVHGAMGFTHEHRLHHFTRRLWAWRDEYGNERYWQERLGAALIAGGAQTLWPFIATRG